ncbi:hypothetical protein GNIT_1221 [Glaciecola nitratireducens FR1064]|uniref:Uncharacterized protein n=1 Tax=Glaciecola nitratireducens (strain JCM 12485 / KCTC 12276 / FR1064) TaxID=1085623 RepID=G4QKV8_GLANF|nr:hypothetical protein GNIT_1221 [Glaciecola nitratireducens FR1064]
MSPLLLFLNGNVQHTYHLTFFEYQLVMLLKTHTIEPKMLIADAIKHASSKIIHLFLVKYEAGKTCPLICKSSDKLKYYASFNSKT